MSAGRPLSARVAIVTGGSAGIGLESAITLARLGASVLMVGRSAPRLEAAVGNVSHSVPDAAVTGMALDVRCEGDMSTMAEQALERYSRIDVLVAAAGILRVGGAIAMLVDTPSSAWDELIDINLTGTFLSNRAVLPAMLEQGFGQIINVSSTSGRRGYAFDTAYCASKFGVIGLTEALAQEVRHRGIRVNAVLPGAIETDMWDQNGPIPKPEHVLPVQRVAELIGFLATLPVDTMCPETIIEPMSTQELPAWRQRPGSATRRAS